MKTIVNCTTGEVTKRELNAEELAQEAKDVKEVKAEKIEQQAEAQAKAAQKAALLERLGITEDEAKLLLG
jgi:hypothetical protein